jgi:hypothetical protein
MRDQSPQPSQIFFPIVLQPVEEEVAAPQAVDDGWGWIEWFTIAQVFWGVLLFVPGSQAYRSYIRAFPYIMSLVALAACAKSSGTDTAVPGARWIVAAFLVYICNLVQPATWLSAGVAQVVFQLSIAAPLFWAARMTLTEKRLQRLLWLVFAANFVSAALGLLQVYYPDTFLPPEFSSLSAQLNPDFLQGLSYIGADDRMIVRPPGLSDLPGGAAIAGATALCLAFSFAIRSNLRHVWRAAYIAAAGACVTVVYLTQVRSMLLMSIGCMIAMALVRLRQGHVVQSGWIAAIGGGLTLGGFAWAVSVGGEEVYERFFGIAETGVMQTFQENRGLFLEYTLTESLFEYPFGAGLGRWGMMTVYFPYAGNWLYPALHAEIQLTGWLFDGGVPLWLCYGGAIVLALRNSYRLAVHADGTLADCATIIFSIQLFITGMCFTGPVFNTQFGIVFWLLAAILYGCHRTRFYQEWYDAQTAEAEAADAEMAQEEGTPA